jgi:hypothetical protein
MRIVKCLFLGLAAVAGSFSDLLIDDLEKGMTGSNYGGWYVRSSQLTDGNFDFIDSAGPVDTVSRLAALKSISGSGFLSNSCAVLNYTLPQGANPKHWAELQFRFKDAINFKGATAVEFEIKADNLTFIKFLGYNANKVQTEYKTLTNVDKEWVTITIASSFNEPISGFAWKTEGPVLSDDKKHQVFIDNLRIVGTIDSATIFTLPGVPVLTSPENRVISDFKPILEWTIVNGASSYIVDMATNATFTENVLHYSLYTNRLYPTIPENTNQWYWRVHAHNFAGDGAFSETRNFTIPVDSFPRKLTLISPQNGEENVSLPVVLHWQKAENVTGNFISYEFEILDDTLYGANSYFFTQWVHDSTFINTKSLQIKNGKRYYWRVRAKSNRVTAVAGNDFGPWSEMFTFKTAIEPPNSAPTMLLPANGVEGISLDFVLQWQAVSGVSGYFVQVADANNFSNIVIDTNITGTSLKLSGLQPSKIYYWRVSAHNEGSAGPWSTVRGFKTATSTGIVVDNTRSGYNINCKLFLKHTGVTFNLPAQSLVTLEVYNLQGMLVQRVMPTNFGAGFHTIKIQGLCQGKYIGVFTANNFKGVFSIFINR